MYPKSFIKKEIKKTLKKMENTPNNSNKEKTEGIAKLLKGIWRENQTHC